MRKISDEVKEKIEKDERRGRCFRALARRDHVCAGRITREHAMIYSGRQVDEAWAIIDLCAKAHSVDEFQDGGIMDKRINEWIALNLIEDWDEVNKKYPRNDWVRKVKWLNKQYGEMKLYI